MIKCEYHLNDRKYYYPDEPGARTTWWGTKEELVNAGLVVPAMFEKILHGNRAMEPDNCKGYHPEQGDWIIYKDRKLKQGWIYRLTYYHEPFTETWSIGRAA